MVVWEKGELIVEEGGSFKVWGRVLGGGGGGGWTFKLSRGPGGI